MALVTRDTGTSALREALLLAFGISESDEGSVLRVVRIDGALTVRPYLLMPTPVVSSGSGASAGTSQSQAVASTGHYGMPVGTVAGFGLSNGSSTAAAASGTPGVVVNYDGGGATVVVTDILEGGNSTSVANNVLDGGSSAAPP